ncbi:MAG: hypothetical protein IPP71_22615 [Bacteroidetes bacterium]|nr:hypothetical protein [Bacteroidota bacterium]
MIKDQFISLLRKPSSINLNMVKGLEEITEQFPYFQNAHLLLAKQYHGHENIRFESYLRKASAYSSDRVMLYDLIKLDTTEVIHIKSNPAKVVTEDLNQNEKKPVESTSKNIIEKIETPDPIPIVENEAPILKVVSQDNIVANIQQQEMLLPEKETTKTEDPKEIIEHRLKELAKEKNSTENIFNEGSVTEVKQMTSEEIVSLGKTEHPPINIEKLFEKRTPILNRKASLFNH